MSRKKENTLTVSQQGDLKGECSLLEQGLIIELVVRSSPTWSIRHLVYFINQHTPDFEACVSGWAKKAFACTDGGIERRTNYADDLSLRQCFDWKK